MAEFDPQGRVVIPPPLREAAAALAEVDVLGLPNCLEIWNADRLRARVQSDGLTENHLNDLAALGI